MKKFWAILITLVMIGSIIVGCKSDNSGETNPNQNVNTVTDTPEPTATPEAELTPAADITPAVDEQTDTPASTEQVAVEEPDNTEAVDTELGLHFTEEGTFWFSEESTLYSRDMTLSIDAPAGAVIYYTLNGKTPDTESTIYSEPLVFKARGGNFPSAYTLRVIAVLADGTISKVAARTYLVASKLEGRFSTVVFSISGDPDELTRYPDGIFKGKNYELRGRESEREVYVEAWNADGESLIAQFAGVRIYGGYSRQTTIKSMKLYSRASYDEDHKNFKFSEFGTLKLDGSDKIIKKYDKLVLRNFGNDMQFGFIRDELSQTLCKLAGFECYEAVIPAVAYLNGEYYGFYWLHENYCDKYLKEKYGDAEGEFVILEGEEQKKNDDDDCQNEVDSYNSQYNKFINMDLTNNANYAKLCDFMDVENYLDYYAWNIALNNWDWPNNNYKCFRYVEADAATLAAEDAVETPDNEVYDGRWRFLVHDMDYTYGIYDQYNAKASYNNLKVILNENDVRYSPLFSKLMDRADCRSYFRNKVMEYLEGPLSEESIKSTYYALNEIRSQELAYFYKHIEQLNRRGDFTMWTTPGNYAGVEKQILEFAETRAAYVITYMNKLLPDLNTETAE